MKHQELLIRVVLLATAFLKVFFLGFFFFLWGGGGANETLKKLPHQVSIFTMKAGSVCCIPPGRVTVITALNGELCYGMQMRTCWRVDVAFDADMRACLDVCETDVERQLVHAVLKCVDAKTTTRADQSRQDAQEQGAERRPAAEEQGAGPEASQKDQDGQDAEKEGAEPEASRMDQDGQDADKEGAELEASQMEQDEAALTPLGEDAGAAPGSPGLAQASPTEIASSPARSMPTPEKLAKGMTVKF